MWSAFSHDGAPWIRYDLLARARHSAFDFWDRAFDLMNAPALSDWKLGKARAAGNAVESHPHRENESDKIIVRSNGTVDYTGKDIAYQLWKAGQFGLDFNYKPFARMLTAYRLVDYH